METINIVDFAEHCNKLTHIIFRLISFRLTFILFSGKRFIESRKKYILRREFMLNYLLKISRCSSLRNHKLKLQISLNINKRIYISFHDQIVIISGPFCFRRAFYEKIYTLRCEVVPLKIYVAIYLLRTGFIVYTGHFIKE